ncbi:hypothetical protein FOA52_012181, partial [Chlamydomonas sp. UWO 241]
MLACTSQGCSRRRHCHCIYPPLVNVTPEDMAVVSASFVCAACHGVWAKNAGAAARALGTQGASVQSFLHTGSGARAAAPAPAAASAKRAAQQQPQQPPPQPPQQQQPERRKRPSFTDDLFDNLLEAPAE